MDENRITLVNANGDEIEGIEYGHLIIHETFDGIEDPEILIIMDDENNLYPLLYDEEDGSFSFIENEELFDAVSTALEDLAENESIE